MFVVPYKNLKRAALVAIGLLGPSVSVQASFLDSLKGNSQTSGPVIQENIKEAKAYIPIPGFGSIGGGLSSKVTDMAFHTQLAEQLWRGVREDLKKKEKLSDEEVSYLQGLEQQFRKVLIARFQQLPASQIESLAQNPSPEIASAQLTVQEMLATLKALSQEASGGNKQKQGKALQAMSDLIQVAQTELIQIQQVDQGEQATLEENQKNKQKWQAFLQAGYQQYLQEQQPAVWAQQLRVQALSKQATPEDWYDYGNHLLTYNLCPPTDETIINALLQAAQSDYEPAAFRLLNIYAPKESCREIGEVYFRLFQLQVNAQSPFPNNVRIHFLARAILLRHRLALKYLDEQIQADIKEGVSKSASNQLWKNLRQCLNGLATEESEEKKAYLKQLNQRVKASYQKRAFNSVLALASETNVMSSDDDSSDDESKTPSPSMQVKALENENIKLSAQYQELTAHLAQAQTRHTDSQQQVEALQAELQVAYDEQTKQATALASLNEDYQSYRLERRQSAELKAQAMAQLSHEKEVLASALATSQQQQRDTAQEIEQLQTELETTQTAKQEIEARLQVLNTEHEDYRLARQESGELKEQTIEQLQTELETTRCAKEEIETQIADLTAEFEALTSEKAQLMAAHKQLSEHLAQAQVNNADVQKQVERLDRQHRQARTKQAEQAWDLYQLQQSIQAMSHKQRQLKRALWAEKCEKIKYRHDLMVYTQALFAKQGQALMDMSWWDRCCSLGQPGDPGFGVAAAPHLPPDFSKLPGSEEIDSDEYGNYRHAVAGVHVWIPAFVYRVGESAVATLFEKYGAHTIEVQDLNLYLGRFSGAERARVIADLAQGKPGPEGWQLHRAFVNAGAVQAGFFMQKYLASKHGNGKSVTSQQNTVPLSLTRVDGYTRSKDMPGCAGQYSDAYVLAKQTSNVHQVASIFQYSALTMLSLAQAQGATSNQHCAWWSADPRGCCPKGCVDNLHDDQEVNVVWQSAGERGDRNKPLTGSCTDPAWASHNGQGSGVMDIKGALWEVAGAVTTGSDTSNPQTLYALGREVDYIALDQKTAFGSQAQLQARGDVPVRLPYRVGRQLDGTFPLFSGDGTYDALALPKSVDAKGLVWPGYDHSRLYTAVTYANLMPVVSGGWLNGDAAGLCARYWHDTWSNDGPNAGFRLSAYGLTWTELAGASGESADSD